jgi:hypothetical protein
VYWRISVCLLGLLTGIAGASCTSGQRSSVQRSCCGFTVTWSICKVSSTGHCDPNSAVHPCGRPPCYQEYAASCTLSSPSAKASADSNLQDLLADRIVERPASTCAAATGESLEDWVNSHHHAKAQVFVEGKTQANGF